MCTAVTYQTNDLYFGRTLDNERSYGEEVVVCPRNYPFHFRETETMQHHYAMIGMAHVAKQYPLYYDAVNEKGLCIAGLNFVGNAQYYEKQTDRYNIAQFEWIPWILGQCASVTEACGLIEKSNLRDIPFQKDMPTASLHWILADFDRSVTVEAVREGIRIYDNPIGVLTNNPPFDQQMFHLNNYMNLTAETPQNTFAPGIPLDNYSRGMGALGLPGDLSSQSRFVRAAFVKMNSVSGNGEAESVSQFFHILGSVDQQRGCCHLGGGQYETTIYTSCCNAHKGIYYYTTYDNHQISGVDMHRENLDDAGLIRFPLASGEQIRMQNGSGQQTVI